MSCLLVIFIILIILLVTLYDISVGQ